MDMDEELEQFCNNCKKNVGTANFATHSAYCQRNIKICEVCDEPIPKNYIKEHEEEYHIAVKCEKCNASVRKWKMPKHQEKCPKRLVTCEFCEGEFFANEAEEHIDFCGSRTELCDVCDKYIMQKHKKKHFEFHQHEENFPRGNNSWKMYQNMKDEFSSKTPEKELKPDKLYDSPHESNRIVTDDFDCSSIVASAPVLQTSNQSSEIHTVCHLCRKSVLWNDYDQHLKRCVTENDFKKCPHCNENIPPSAWKDHVFKTCGMLKDSRIHASKSESMSVRRSQSNSAFNDEERAACRSTSSYAVCNELTEDDQAMACPFCKRQLLLHVIQDHIDSCSERYFECHLCCEQVLKADRDKHLTFQCKMLQDKFSSDLYECPLCGERMFEKDKLAHESLACRTLLEDDGPLYSLLDEKTSKNHAKETKKNSTETCMNCKKKIPVNELPNHEQSCKTRKFCFYCDKELYGDATEALHLRVCEVYKQINNINDSERDIDMKGAKPKHSKFSEIAKPKVGKCSYCKTTLNDNILLYHEKECVHQPIKCPDCSATMLLKDVEKHHCKSTYKESEKGRGRKRYNKAEKSESNSSWLSSLFGGHKSNPKTIDQYQNERNQAYEEHMDSSRYPAIGNINYDQYFVPRDIIEEPKIPCEFCEEQFPASDIVLHMTGCNPRVSLPKSDSIERQKENEVSSRHLKRTHDSSTTSQNFFTAGRGVNKPPADYKNIERHWEQRTGARPGEFLNYNSGASSKCEEIFSGYQSIKVKNQSSSALKSVWNDSPDVEMEENDPKTSSEIVAHNVEKDVNEHSKESAHETSKHSVESDDEMSSMFEYIEGKTTKSNTLKGKNCSSTLDKHNEQSKGPSVEGVKNSNFSLL